MLSEPLTQEEYNEVTRWYHEEVIPEFPDAQPQDIKITKINAPNYSRIRAQYQTSTYILVGKKDHA